MWNTRRLGHDAILGAYEALLQEFGTDYREVNHANVGADVLKAFFGALVPSVRRLPNEQRFDYAGLAGRLLSSSYVPAADDPRQAPMLAALAAL